MNSAKRPWTVAPFHLAGPRGSLFCVMVEPTAARRSDRAVLHFAAFAEEMNKSRRMVAIQARRLAAHGSACLIVDPIGTGDSGGNFEDGSREAWADDYGVAARWLADHGYTRLSLWGNRLGAAFALAHGRAPNAPERIALWQPVLDGTAFLRQFDRLRRAAELFQGGEPSAVDGTDDEIAGYALSPALRESIGRIRPDELLPACPTVAWFETSTLDPARVSVAASRTVDRWRETGVHCDAIAVAGEPYWSTTETMVNDELVDITTRFLTDG